MPWAMAASMECALNQFERGQSYIEYTGLEPPIIMTRPKVKPMHLNCVNCGAPAEPICSYCLTPAPGVM